MPDHNFTIDTGAPLSEPERQYYYMDKARNLVEATIREIGRPLQFCITTFGCQMNARDSEKLAGILKEIGYVEIEEEQKADFVIFNTCTVRENANQRLYGRLGQINRAKRKNPNMLIGLCGCMMQEDTVVEKLKKSYSFVDLIFGTHNIYKFAELVYHRLKSGVQIIDIWEQSDQIVEDLPSERKFSFKSGVNITFGCNNFCTYCIVPYVRGRERSRSKQDIIAEIKALAEDGVIEVMLLGQNVNSYGQDLTKPQTFTDLLQAVEQIEGIKRIRFMTSHPKDLSDELITWMGQSKKICKHLHLPMQSGSSRILDLMNRRYDKETYLNLVDKIRSAVPDISLTTDIIVGFPGETEADFEDTLDVVRKVRFDSAFTFIYSKRTGTPAASMECTASESEVKDRFNRLLTLIQTISAEGNRRDVGTIQDALVESLNDHNSELVTGRLSNNMLVHFPGDERLIGQLISVKLMEGKGFYYLGERM